MVPSIGRFTSLIGSVPEKKTVIDYYEPIHFPITKFETVEEVLKRSEEATKSVGQEYVINTFDLGVCMKALPWIWKHPDEYKKHIVIPGPFHTKMNFINMLTNKKARGSGYAEILIEAKLVSSGTLKSVLSGKAYAIALFNLKVVTEALERLLFEVFMEEHEIEIEPEALLNVIKECSSGSCRAQLDTALHDESVAKMIEMYEEYQDKVRGGHLGKTAMYWMSITDRAKLLFLLTHAVKTNNRPLFHKCNGEMAEIFFEQDGPNYSR